MKDHFDWAEDNLICRRVVWSQLAVSWCHPDSSRPVTEVRNSCINVGDHVRSKSRTSIFRNVETLMVLLPFKELTSCRFRACTGRVIPLAGSIPVGLQCTGNLWQLQCKLDVFRRGYQLVLYYRRVIEHQQQMLLQYIELFVTAICCNNCATFGIIIFVQDNFQYANVQNLRFSQRCCWRFRSSGIWRRVVGHFEES